MPGLDFSKVYSKTSMTPQQAQGVISVFGADAQQPNTQLDYSRFKGLDFSRVQKAPAKTTDSMVLADKPGYEYGDILPVKKNIKTGERSFAVPEMIRAPVRGIQQFEQAAKARSTEMTPDMVATVLASTPEFTGLKPKTTLPKVVPKEPPVVEAGEKIASAAKQTPEGKILTGAKHADIPGEGKEGFVTDKGKFVTREQALSVAEADKQLVQKPVEPDKLHSEDIGRPKPPSVLSTSKVFSPEQPLASTKSPGTPIGVHQLLERSRGESVLDMEEARRWLKPLRGTVPEETWNKFLDHADDPKGVPLSPEETQLFNNTIGKLKTEIDQGRAELTGMGVDTKRLMDDTGSMGGAIRQRVGKNTPAERVRGALSPQGVRSLSKSAGTTRARSMMNITQDGKRTTVYINDKDEVMDAANPKMKLGDYDDTTNKARLANGQEVPVTDATRKEIETATGGKIQYEKNGLLTYMTTLLQVRRALRSARDLEAIKQSPEFSQIARAPMTKGETPFSIINGRKRYWREVQGIPAFRGYKFEPRIAEELEDFTHGVSESVGELDFLDRANRFSLGLFFFMSPFHGYNLTQMALTTKDIGGLVSDPWAKDFAESARDVMEFRKPYTQMIRSGVNPFGLKFAGEGFRKAMVDAADISGRRNPQGWAQLAKLAGMPVNGVKEISQGSWSAIGSYQDMLQLTLMKGLKRRGLSDAEARELIARTFPSDSPPSRVLGSRLLGQTLHGQFLFNFPHYLYNRTKGPLTMIASMAKKGQITDAERLRAIRQVLTVAATYEFGKHIITPMLKQMTGNQNAQSGGFGYDVWPEAAERLYQGMEGGQYGRTIGQTIQSMASPGYAAQAYDLVRGVQPYFGKPTSLPGETPKEIASDYASDIAYKLSPVQRGIGIVQGRMSPTDLIWQQVLGVKYPRPLPQSVQRELKSRRKHGTAWDQLYNQLDKEFNESPDNRPQR